MNKKAKKNQKTESKICCCTPNCIYFPQEVSEEDIISQTIENGIVYRKVKRYCMYDGSQINSWSHECGRRTPKTIVVK